MVRQTFFLVRQTIIFGDRDFYNNEMNYMKKYPVVLHVRLVGYARGSACSCYLPFAWSVSFNKEMYSATRVPVKLSLRGVDQTEKNEQALTPRSKPVV